MVHGDEQINNDMKSITQIDVNWWEPLNIHYFLEKKVYLPPDLRFVLDYSTCVYQIYGDHPAYGSNVLLFIGRLGTPKLGETVSNLIHRHNSNKFVACSSYMLRVGVVQYKKELINDKELMMDVESLLIAANTPALNDRYIDCARASAKNLLVVNYGYSGAIVVECNGRDYCK